MNITSVLANTGSMAASGASIGGPWGAAIGGAIGLGKGLWNGITGDNAERNRKEGEMRELQVVREQAMQGGMSMAGAVDAYRPSKAPVQNNTSTEKMLNGLLGSMAMSKSLGLLNKLPAPDTASIQPVTLGATAGLSPSDLGYLNGM